LASAVKVLVYAKSIAAKIEAMHASSAFQAGPLTRDRKFWAGADRQLEEATDRNADHKAVCDRAHRAHGECCEAHSRFSVPIDPSTYDAKAKKG
jgi:hypothetical protein